MSSSDKTTLSYINMDDLNKPHITCELLPYKTCSLIGGTNMKLFISTRVDKIQFKHPSIDQYIDIMAYYDRLAENNPPW